MAWSRSKPAMSVSMVVTWTSSMMIWLSTRKAKWIAIQGTQMWCGEKTRGWAESAGHLNDTKWRVILHAAVDKVDWTVWQCRVHITTYLICSYLPNKITLYQPPALVASPLSLPQPEVSLSGLLHLGDESAFRTTPWRPAASTRLSEVRSGPGPAYFFQTWTWPSRSGPAININRTWTWTLLDRVH